MPRANPLRPVSGILDANPQLASWNARRRRDEAITTVLRRQLPRPVAASVWVADVREGSLELATPSGAIAASLRQRAPELLAALRREGCEFTGLRVRVQPRNATIVTDKRVYRQRDSGWEATLTRFESGLAPGPLKAALRRWLRSGGRRGDVD